MICILSDYGVESIYVAEMVGVIKSLNPEEEVLILMNGITRQDVFEAAFTLKAVAKEYPAGTIFLCIVDPGVGTPRMPLIIVGEKHIFIGPDNGSLYLAAKSEGILEIYKIEIDKLPPRKISKTFHGRDIFAVAAALLSLGFKPSLIGSIVDEIKKIEIAEPETDANVIKGKIIYVDSFGNLITNIGLKYLSLLEGRDSLKILLNGKEYLLPFRSTYAEVPEMQPLALIDSFDLLELAVNKGSAKDYFSSKIGDDVLIEC